MKVENGSLLYQDFLVQKQKSEHSKFKLAFVAHYEGIIKMGG